MDKIGFGKFGKTIWFDYNKWKPQGEGCREAPIAFQTLANNNPNITFYLLGRSDFSRLKPNIKKELFKYDNVVDVWKGFKAKENDDHYKRPYLFLKEHNVELDFGIFYNGPASGCNVTNLIKKEKNPDEYYKSALLIFLMYVGPIYYYLNKTNLKYINICCDPRYFPQKGRDLYNRPKITLSQMNHTETSLKVIKSYNDQTKINVNENGVYAGIEKARLIGWFKKDIFNLEKTKKYTIILNQAKNAKNKRTKWLNEYVFDYINDVDVYGKWEEKFYSDDRFKGPKSMEELDIILDSTKYSILFPMESEWLSPKLYEIINHGIIPFVHPEYDKQRLSPLPDFCRLVNKEDFFTKCEYLEQNEEYRLELLKELQNNFLKDEYYDGTWFNSLLMKYVNKVVNNEL